MFKVKITLKSIINITKSNYFWHLYTYLYNKLKFFANFKYIIA